MKFQISEIDGIHHTTKVACILPTRIIRQFFEGTLQTRNTAKDHVWIVKHKKEGILFCETLTVEPRSTGTKYDGSQCEIAIRFPKRYDESYTPYSGYSISDDDHFHGYDMNGH